MLLRKKIKKIPCYVLVFDQVEIITRTLNFLTEFSNQLEIIVIENPSINSPEIKKVVDEYGARAQISRYYIFDKNITGNAFEIILKREMKLISKSPLVMLTDGDLTSTQKGWLSEEISILNNNLDVFSCGVSLDLKNLPLKSFPDARDWLPDDVAIYEDYIEVCTGIHLLLSRGYELKKFINWLTENKLNFVDSNMHKYCYEVLGKKWGRTKNAKALHLTWDLYSDINNEYTKLKTSKSFNETWHTYNTSKYSFTDYRK